MSFVKKTPAEFEALSEYQKEKYLDEKAAHEAAIVKDQVEKSAKAAIEAMKEELKEERAAELKGLTDANEEALKKLSEKYDVEVDALKAQLSRAKVGEVGERMKGFSAHVIEKLSTPEGELMIKEFFAGQREKFAMEMDSEAIKAMSTPVGGVAPQFAPIVGPGHDEIHARTVIPVFPTTSNLIKFIQYVVDEGATGFGMVAEGGQKPDLGYTPTVKEAAVRKIAGILDCPMELMDDVVGFRAWIAYELPKAYLDVEDYQIFKGPGTGENLLGLWYQADFQSLPLGSVNSGSNAIDKIAAGITEVRMLKRATSAVFVSPVEYMEIFINKGNTEEYTYPIILRSDGVITIGGVPIYWSNVFEEGEGLVGDFARGTAIFQRMAMNIRYSEENKDNFEKNIVSIRLEGRIALPIYYPDAFLKLFNPAS